MTAALIIFAATYFVIAIGRLPGFRVDRTGAAIIGAALMIAFNVLTIEEAYAAIDYDTIILLFGMMIVVANLRLSGFFSAVSAWVVERAHGPVVLLGAIVLVSGIFSAFFVNDTMCIAMTPLVLELAGALRRNPAPYLLGVAMGANVGSTATITGNPQNMVIGSVSRINYLTFAAALGPVAAAGLALTILVLVAVYRKDLRPHQKIRIEHERVRVNRVLMWKAVVVSAGMVAFFFAGWPVPKVALVAGAVLLITRRVKPERVYREIDWGLLVMFIGLFIVVAGVDRTPLAASLLNEASRFRLNNPVVLTGASAILSNLVSNVPAVLLFKPFIPHLPDATRAWLILAMSSTLAGNLTLLGSIANLIVVQRAARDGVNIGFWEYLKAGLPLTVLTIAVGVLLLR
jgi:Na+/H+ antiporter NhaD/arsenite permease-like protein